ncbi:hypothetical protein ACFVGM_08015 [Kitasatospora purpeofusca]|uniref:hypothetical protein n=1 Tax=Kitasatospora purpeofusca TaxID=67352 RepID=UPI0036BA14A9
MSAENSADFKFPEDRHPGLYIRTFKIAKDGTRYDDSGVITVESEPDASAYHPSATWPACRCPKHRNG